MATACAWLYFYTSCAQSLRATRWPHAATLKAEMQSIAVRSHPHEKEFS